MKRDGMLYTVLFTFIICIVFVFFLALANELTKDRVASNNRLTERSAILSALGIAYTSPDQVDSLYDAQVSTLNTDQGPVYKATVEGQARYAAKVAGPGLWGTIRAILAVDERVERIEGFQIVSHNETPGLGGRIDEAWFKAQFRGEKIGSEGIAVLQGSGKGDPDPDNSQVDAVTGASRTSQAVQDMVNKEISLFKSLRDKGGLK